MKQKRRYVPPAVQVDAALEQARLQKRMARRPALYVIMKLTEIYASYIISAIEAALNWIVFAVNFFAGKGMTLLAIFIVATGISLAVWWAAYGVDYIITKVIGVLKFIVNTIGGGFMSGVQSVGNDVTSALGFGSPISLPQPHVTTSELTPPFLSTLQTFLTVCGQDMDPWHEFRIVMRYFWSDLLEMCDVVRWFYPIKFIYAPLQYITSPITYASEPYPGKNCESDFTELDKACMYINIGNIALPIIIICLVLMAVYFFWPWIKQTLRAIWDTLIFLTAGWHAYLRALQIEA